jgi:hypothetical protein
VPVIEKQEEMGVLLKKREETLRELKDVTIRKSKTPVRVGGKKL